MTAQTPAPVASVPSPATMASKKKTPVKSPRPRPTGSDRFMDEAKKLVVDNYNAHRDRERNAPITSADVYIVWFTKSHSDWTAVVGSTVLGNLRYEVSYVHAKSMAYINIYRKINHAAIAY